MVHSTQALKRKYTQTPATITTQLHEWPLPQTCNSETSPHVPLSIPSKTHTCFDWAQATPDAKVLYQFVIPLNTCMRTAKPKHSCAPRRQLTNWISRTTLADWFPWPKQHRFLYQCQLFPCGKWLASHATCHLLVPWSHHFSPRFFFFAAPLLHGFPAFFLLGNGKQFKISIAFV